MCIRLELCIRISQIEKIRKRLKRISVLGRLGMGGAYICYNEVNREGKVTCNIGKIIEEIKNDSGE